MGAPARAAARRGAARRPRARPRLRRRAASSPRCARRARPGRGGDRRGGGRAGARERARRRRAAARVRRLAAVRPRRVRPRLVLGGARAHPGRRGGAGRDRAGCSSAAAGCCSPCPYHGRCRPLRSRSRASTAHFDPLGQHVRFFTRRVAREHAGVTGLRADAIRRDGPMLVARAVARLAARPATARAATTTSDVLWRRPAGRGSTRPGTRAARPCGSLRRRAAVWPSWRQVSGFAGSRSIACSSARSASACRCRAACSIAARSNSGSTDERVAVVGDPGDRGRRPAAAPLLEPRRARRPARGPSGPAAARSRTAISAISSTSAAASRAQRRARRRAAPARLAAAEALAQRRARGDPAGAEQRRERVAGDEPRPVDRRVHAEDDHDDRRASPARRARRPRAGRGRARRMPTARAAAAQPGARREQREREPDPAEVGSVWTT